MRLFAFVLFECNEENLVRDLVANFMKPYDIHNPLTRRNIIGILKFRVKTRESDVNLWAFSSFDISQIMTC